MPEEQFCQHMQHILAVQFTPHMDLQTFVGALIDDIGPFTAPDALLYLSAVVHNREYETAADSSDFKQRLLLWSMVVPLYFTSFFDRSRSPRTLVLGSVQGSEDVC